MKCKLHPEVATKKYCRDCRFCKRWTGFYSTYPADRKFCNKIINTKVRHKDTPFEHVKMDKSVYVNTRKANKHNDCKYYEKRRWWM